MTEPGSLVLGASTSSACWEMARAFLTARVAQIKRVPVEGLADIVMDASSRKSRNNVETSNFQITKA
jgi:hypothetical protein